MTVLNSILLVLKWLNVFARFVSESDKHLMCCFEVELICVLAVLMAFTLIGGLSGNAFIR